MAEISFNHEKKQKVAGNFTDRTVRLSKDLDDTVKHYCKKAGGITVSSLIKMALTHFMSTHKIE